MKNILGFFAITLLGLSCNKESESTQPSCVDQFIESRQLTKYTGQDLGFAIYYSRYEFNGKEYYVAGSSLVNMASMPEDCDGNYLCLTQNGLDFDCEELQDFYRDAVNKGIIGF